MSSSRETSPAREPSSVMGLLERLVPGRRRKASKMEPNEVLRAFLSQGSTRWEEDEYSSEPHDPEREAAMNRVRQLRIHTA